MGFLPSHVRTNSRNSERNLIVDITEYLEKKPSRRSVALKIEKAEIAIEQAEEKIEEAVETIERLQEYLDQLDHEEEANEEEEMRAIPRSSRRQSTELDQLGAVLKTIPSLLSIFLKKHP